MSRTEDLEARVRDALAEAASAVEISPTAWREHQTLIRRRHGRRRAYLAVAAAAAVVATVAVPMVIGGGEGGGTPPAGGRTPAPTVSRGGTPGLANAVEVTRLELAGGTASVRLSVTQQERSPFDEVCVERRLAKAGDYWCLQGSAFSYDPEVAIDYVSFGPDQDLPTLAGAVDARVTALQAWLADGIAVDLDLVDLGSDGLRGFALLTEEGAALPQRLVARGRAGNVLQAIDLLRRFGEGWSQPPYACAGDRVAEYVPNGDVFPNAYVALGTADARISARLSRSDSAEACLERLRARALGGWFAAGSLVVVVVAPEVETVRLIDARRGSRADRVLDEVAPTRVAGSPWQVATFGDLSAADAATAELLALDQTGRFLDRAPVRQPSAP